MSLTLARYETPSMNNVFPCGSLARCDLVYSTLSRVLCSVVISLCHRYWAEGRFKKKSRTQVKERHISALLCYYLSHTQFFLMFCMNVDFNAHKSSLHKRCLLIKWENVGVCSRVCAQKSSAVSLLEMRHMDVCVLPGQPACISNICIHTGSKEGTNWISNVKDFSSFAGVFLVCGVLEENFSKPNKPCEAKWKSFGPHPKTSISCPVCWRRKKTPNQHTNHKGMT